MQMKDSRGLYDITIILWSFKDWRTITNLIWVLSIKICKGLKWRRHMAKRLSSQKMDSMRKVLILGEIVFDSLSCQGMNFPLPEGMNIFLTECMNLSLPDGLNLFIPEGMILPLPEGCFFFWFGKATNLGERKTKVINSTPLKSICYKTVESIMDILWFLSHSLKSPENLYSTKEVE